MLVQRQYQLGWQVGLLYRRGGGLGFVFCRMNTAIKIVQANQVGHAASPARW